MLKLVIRISKFFTLLIIFKVPNKIIFDPTKIIIFSDLYPAKF